MRDIGLAIAEARREYDEGLPTDTIPHLIAAYGSRCRDVLELARTGPIWRHAVARGLAGDRRRTGAGGRAEMAMTLADALIRRTPVGALGYPGDQAVTRAADIVGAELRWPEERRRAESGGRRGVLRDRERVEHVGKPEGRA